MVERLVRNEKVRGSNPLFSTSSFSPCLGLLALKGDLLRHLGGCREKEHVGAFGAPRSWIKADRRLFRFTLTGVAHGKDQCSKMRLQSSSAIEVGSKRQRRRQAV